MGWGMLKTSKIIFTKKGDRMAFLAFEDDVSKAEVVLFPKTFAKVEPWLSGHQIFFIKGNLDLASVHQCKIKAMECIPLDLFFDHYESIEQLIIKLPAQMSETLLQELAPQFEQGKVPLSFTFTEQNKQFQVKAKQRVRINAALLSLLEKYYIEPKIIVT